MLQVVRYVLGYSLCLCEMAIFCILIKHRGEVKGGRLVKSGIGFLSLGIISISIFVIVDKALVGYSISGGQDVLLVILMILIFVCHLIVFIYQFKVQLQKKEDYRTLVYENETLVKVISANKEINEQRRKMGHDFNNHISCIDMLLQMGNVERAREYIARMNASYSSQYFGLSVGNEIADAIINEKYLKAEKHQIAFSVKGTLEDVQIEAMDLCIILSNSLDNAIEAALKVEKISERYIRLNIESKEEMVNIIISNSVQDLCKEGKVLLTTKSDKEHHGIGMNSMQAAAIRNGGKISWQCKDHTFRLEITLKKAS